MWIDVCEIWWMAWNFLYNSIKFECVFAVHTNMFKYSFSQHKSNLLCFYKWRLFIISVSVKRGLWCRSIFDGADAARDHMQFKPSIANFSIPVTFRCQNLILLRTKLICRCKIITNGYKSIVCASTMNNLHSTVEIANYVKYLCVHKTRIGDGNKLGAPGISSHLIPHMPFYLVYIHLQPAFGRLGLQQLYV